MAAKKKSSKRVAHGKAPAKKASAKKAAKKSAVDISGPKNSRDRTVQSSARTGSFSATKARKAIQQYLKR